MLRCGDSSHEQLREEHVRTDCSAQTASLLCVRRLTAVLRLPQIIHSCRRRCFQTAVIRLFDSNTPCTANI